MCTIVPTTEEALTARLLQATIHALELYGIYLGKELGPDTVRDLAAAGLPRVEIVPVDGGFFRLYRLRAA